MKKSIILQFIFIFLLLALSSVPSYGKGNFTQYYNQALEFYKQGKYDQARQEFEKALEIKPNDVYALYGLGNTHYCKTKYDDAINTYVKAININPDYPKVHYSLSLAYNKLGKTKEAEKEKKIFRKLSKGGKISKSTSVAPPKTKSKTSTQKTKKEFEFGNKRSSIPQKKEAVDQKKKDFQSSNTENNDFSTTVETKPKATLKTSTKKKEVKVVQRMDTKAKSQTKKDDDSHSIFSNEYTGSKSKTRTRVFVRKYRSTFGFIAKPVTFIKEKWGQSSLNKVWISVAGFIFTVQMWLCIVTFLGIIVWRIKKTVEDS